MTRESSAGGFAETGDDIDDARRHADFFGELGEIKRGERRVFGGFDDDGVARSEGRGDAPTDEPALVRLTEEN